MTAQKSLFKRYPKIRSYKDVIYEVKRRYKYSGGELPTLSFTGTVKLHGSNLGVCFPPDGEVGYQSRNQPISYHDDNYGFVHEMTDNNFVAEFAPILESLRKDINDHTSNVVIYGEWCGKGIQDTVAISELPKMFVIFDILIRKSDEESYYLDLREYKWVELKGCNVFNIHNFPTYEMDIDFSQPHNYQNDLINLTEMVEKQCPVGFTFGVTGVGEGLVWKPNDMSLYDGEIMFKVKGTKHSDSKVKVLAEVDVEKLNSVKEFLDRVITDHRMEKGIDYLNEMHMEVIKPNTGKFLSWMFADVMDEEADVLEASELTRKDFSRDLGERCRKWYLNRCDEI